MNEIFRGLGLAAIMFVGYRLTGSNLWFLMLIPILCVL